MRNDPAQLGRQVVEACLGLGFALAGIAPAEPTARGDDLRAWLAGGKHGSMAYLGRNVECRLDIRRLLPGARAVIVVADQYATRGARPETMPRGATGARGRIARYAQGRDYHTVIRKRLHGLADSLRERFPGGEFRTFVDTAPVLEREHAARAGLGWIGKHTLMINPEVGSYVLLGGIATTLDLAPPAEQRGVADHCGTCTRCIDACPTGAISPYSVDASKCISYLTIERRGPIDPGFHRAMADWVFGCDVCQEVCPHNGAHPARRAETGAVNPAYRPTTESLDLLEVLGWTEADRRRTFSGSALKRARLDMMKRNAIIAAGNALSRRCDTAIRARLEALAVDPAEGLLVRETAGAVLAGRA